MNLSFLHPAFLWALPLAAGPAVLHWLTRPRSRRVLFSSVELLQTASRGRLSRGRLREILLLAARCGLLAALALLFARPVARWGRDAAAGEERLAVAILMDVSYSMDARHAGGAALDWARAQAGAFAESLGREDRAGLVVFSDRVEASLPLAADKARLREALGALRVSSRTTRLGPALETAYRMLSAEEGLKAVVVFSDLAAHGWRGLSPDRNVAGFDPSVRVVLAEAGPARENAALSAVRLERSGGEARMEGAVEAAAWGRAPGARGWRLELDGTAAAAGSLSFSGGRGGGAFSAAAPRGFSQGAAVLEPDALPIDDRFFFVDGRPGGFSVLVVNGSPSFTPTRDEAYYLGPVLEVLAREGVRSRTVAEEFLGSGDIGSWDVVVLLNPGNLSAAAVVRLQGHLRAGGGLLVTAGDRLDPGSLATLCPGRFTGAAVRGEGIRPGGDAAEHPATGALLGDGGFEWRSLEAGEARAFAPFPGAAVLLASDPGEAPLLVAGPVSGGAAAVLATTLDRDWTNLPSKPVFPALCRELLFFLAGKSGKTKDRSWVVGRPIEAETGTPVPARVEVARPDGTMEAGSVRAGRLSYERTDVPGVYAAIVPGREKPIARFAVNLDSGEGEGDSTRLEKATAAGVLPGADMLWIPFPESAAEKFRERVEGRDMTSVPAAAVVGLFSLESLLLLMGGRGSARSKTAVVVLLALSFLLPGAVRTEEAPGNRFVFCQLRHGGEWDPYPGTWESVADFLGRTTSVEPWPERRVLAADDPGLFESPFLWMAGRDSFSLTVGEKESLRRYLSGGGFLLVDDSAAERNGPFGRSARELPESLFPGSSWAPVPEDHALFRAFFLLKGAPGRRAAEKSLSGLWVEGRMVALYVPNDLLGAWARGPLGDFLYPCEPGGETQRAEAFKLTLNAVVFSLTGTYKTDAIHRALLDQKLRQ